MSILIWSIFLDAIALIPLWVVGNHKKVGWLLYIGVMGLWIVFAFDSGAYGFIPGCLLYSFIYYRNWRKWNVTVELSD